LPKAVSLAEELLSEFKTDISKLELKPGTGGVFEVSLNDQIIFSKKEIGRFPNEGELLGTVKEGIK
jgi:selenoprotein W-related protein